MKDRTERKGKDRDKPRTLTTTTSGGWFLICVVKWTSTIIHYTDILFFYKENNQIHINILQLLKKKSILCCETW
jgi:hypothetical protein